MTPCQLIRYHQFQQEHLLGIIYKDWVFIKGESYSSEELNLAIRQTQQKLQARKMCLLLADNYSNYVICYEDSNLELFKGKEQDSKWILEVIINAIRHESGLIKTHRYKLRTYPRSLFGDELVTWLSQYLNCSREEAVKIGETLIEQGWLHHTWHDHQCQDKHLFYRFYQDKGSIIPLLTH